MIPNVHQSLDEIINVSSPEQKILWQHVKLICGENAAVQQYVYSGSLTGHPMTIFNARVLWLAYELTSFSTWANGTTVGGLSIYDENNVASGFIGSGTGYWDATAAAFRSYTLPIEFHNVYFSRCVNILIKQAKFIGFKLTR